MTRKQELIQAIDGLLSNIYGGDNDVATAHIVEYFEYYFPEMVKLYETTHIPPTKTEWEENQVEEDDKQCGTCLYRFSHRLCNTCDKCISEFSNWTPDIPTQPDSKERK